MMGNFTLKNIYLALAVIFVFLSVSGLAETAEAATPNIKWAKSFDRFFSDANSIQQTSDGGYIAAGGMERFGNDDSRDYAWVAKLDASGNTIWQKRFYGVENAEASSIQQTSDGGYIVAGRTGRYERNSWGDFSIVYNAWVVKLNARGNIVWQKNFGGSREDSANSIQQTKDGGYIFAGMTSSADGDVTGNHEDGDIWVVKLNASGGIVWQKYFGGTGSDYANSIQQTSDDGYIVAGTINNPTDKASENFNPYDAFVIKLNASGNIMWQKSFGDSGWNTANFIQQTSDDGYIFAGYTLPSAADYNEAWIVKLNASGDIEWQKHLGGSGGDEANSIQQTDDGGYIFAGYTTSNDGDVVGVHGLGDLWIVKLNASGDIVWQKCFGGSAWDYANSIQQTNDGGYIVAGSTYSTGSDMTDNHDNRYSLVVKLNASGNIVWQEYFSDRGYDDGDDSGCNAGFGLLAFVTMGALPFVFRKNIRQ